MQGQNINLDKSAEKPDSLFELLEKGQLNPGQMNALANLVGDSGNEGIQGILMERMRASGGRAGMMHTLADDVNEAVSARTGSTEVDIGGRTNMSVPIIENTADLEPATAAIYMHLEEAGVPESDLVQALAAGGPDNNMATFEAMHTLATDNGLDDIASFTQGAYAFAWGQEAGNVGLAPELGQQQPEPAPQDAVLELGGNAPTPLTIKI